MPLPPSDDLRSIGALSHGRLLIDKQARRLYLTAADGTERAYPIAIGRNASPDKAVEGDEATPLGSFYVCARNPRSMFFLSVCLSYPNVEHAERGLAAGLISSAEHQAIVEAIGAGRMPPQHTRLGGEIYIHGHAPDAPPSLSTRGCIALDNAAMQVVYDAATLGMPVRIVARS